MTHNPNDLAKLIAGKLIERRDAKASQTQTGAYVPVREHDELVPWRLSDVVDHLEGRSTYGHYLVSAAGTCRVLAFDIDLRAKAKPDAGEEPIMFDGVEIDPREVWAGPVTPARRDLGMQLRCMTEGIARQMKKLLDIQVLATYSGCKGMHVYGVLDPGTPASDARELSRMVIDSMDGAIVPDRGNNFYRHDIGYKALSIEVFPKQDEIKEGGFGNLMRLPLGINRKTGKPGFFIDLNTPQEKTGLDDPMVALQQGSVR